jgi:hypothetical protein
LLAELPSDPDAEQEVTWPGRKGWMGRCHFRNWIDCIKSQAQPNASGELAQRAGTLCCLTTIARLCNRRLRWNFDTERFLGDEQANALVTPARRTNYELPSPR